MFMHMADTNAGRLLVRVGLKLTGSEASCEPNILKERDVLFPELGSSSVGMNVRSRIARRRAAGVDGG